MDREIARWKKPVGKHSPLRRIHDALYLVDGEYVADNPWSADTLDAIADIVAQYIPRPT